MSRSNTLSLMGWMLIATGCISFPGFTFAAVISKLLPWFNNPIIIPIRNDRYYCFLVPLTLPVLVIVVYFQWLFVQLFKHA